MRPQPQPAGGTGDCWQELIDALPHHPLRAEMIARRDLGIARYGQPLRHGDGRDRARDLREELLDAAVYAFDLHGLEVALALLELAHDPYAFVLDLRELVDLREAVRALPR